MKNKFYKDLFDKIQEDKFIFNFINRFYRMYDTNQSKNDNFFPNSINSIILLGKTLEKIYHKKNQDSILKEYYFYLNPREFTLYNNFLNFLFNSGFIFIEDDGKYIILEGSTDLIKGERPPYSKITIKLLSQDMEDANFPFALYEEKFNTKTSEFLGSNLFWVSVSNKILVPSQSAKNDPDTALSALMDIPHWIDNDWKIPENTYLSLINMAKGSKFFVEDRGFNESKS